MLPVIYIAFHFPPRGGAGVQRSLKFVKYLPAFGVRPLVVTGNHEPNARGLTDPSLHQEIPSSIQVLRTLWTFDRQSCGKREHAAQVDRIAEIVSSENPACIVVSMSPFTDSRLAADLAHRLSVPWVADLRDPWALDEFQVYPTAIHRLITLRRMRDELRSARLVIMNTPEAAKLYNEKIGASPNQRVVSITNGYDADDFTCIGLLPKDPEHFEIVHNGSLLTEMGLRLRRRSLEHALLGRHLRGMDPLTRSHYFLVQAVKRLVERKPELARVLRVSLIGKARPVDREIIEKAGLTALFDLPGYLEHRESLQRLMRGDLLFFPMHNMPRTHRTSIVPGKLYEYMASGKPILAAVPPGDARDFVEACGTGMVCAPDDVDAMCTCIEESITRWRQGLPYPRTNREFVEQFERRRLAQRLAEELAALHPADSRRKQLAGI